MHRYTGFSDLCIPVTSKENLKPIICEAIELGYRNIAVEQIFDATNKKANNKDSIPSAYCLKELKAELSGQIRLLNRLTVVFKDVYVSVLLNQSTNARGYDIVAALPTDETSLQYACQTMICDIITYNNDAQWIKLHRKFYYLAVQRNIAFEVKYAPAIVNSNHRKSSITRAHRYHSFGKSKNVIFSSEARNPFQLRSPYDIANLGFIFGLSEEQSKQATRDVPNRILMSAQGRRYGKAGVAMFARERTDSDDYSDTELEEDISDEDDNNDDDGNTLTTAVEEMDVTMTAGGKEDDIDELIEMQPPKKMIKHAKPKE